MLIISKPVEKDQTS